MRAVSQRLIHRLVFAAVVAAAALAAQEANFPADLDTFLARDAHEGVTFAARPLRDSTEAEAVFGKNAAPLRAGVLPVELLIVNQRAEVVEAAVDRVVLVTDEKKFEQVEPQEIAWALYPPPESKKPINPTRIPSRIPKDKNRGKREEAEAALRSRQLRAAVAPPGGRARGYLYFKVGETPLDLAEVRVYIPEVVALPEREALLFFEISLKPYAH